MSISVSRRLEEFGKKHPDLLLRASRLEEACLEEQQRKIKEGVLKGDHPHVLRPTAKKLSGLVKESRSLRNASCWK